MFLSEEIYTSLGCLDPRLIQHLEITLKSSSNPWQMWNIELPISTHARNGPGVDIIITPCKSLLLQRSGSYILGLEFNIIVPGIREAWCYGELKVPSYVEPMQCSYNLLEMYGLVFILHHLEFSLSRMACPPLTLRLAIQ